MDTWIILFCVLVQLVYNIQLSAYDDILIAKDGVEISYNVTRSDYCRTGEEKVQLFNDINLTDCVIECGLRNHCLALSYHHGMHSCLLLRSTETSDVIDEPCDYILKSDMTVHTTPCVNACSDGMSCDLDTEECTAKECQTPTPKNGKLFGNRLTIGSKVRYKCEIGHHETTKIYTGTCLYDGTWSHIANCAPSWIVLQRRLSPSDFYKTWEEYKAGFRDLNGNFWLGNEKIWALTQTGTWKLRIELTWKNESGYAEYSSFAIGNEASNYVLTVGGYTGNVGDSLTGHSGKKFTTYDRDNDSYESNCALLYKGAWWHGACHSSNLNGEYGNQDYAKGLSWSTWKGYKESMDTTEMKIQRVA